MREEAIEIAAQWWGDRLREPTVKSDIGVNSKSSNDAVYTFLFLTVTRQEQRKRYSEIEIGQFIKSLKELLDLEWTESRPVYVFGVDYHPDNILDIACKMAGINHIYAAFPLKTTMWLKEDEVTVRCGYGSPIRWLMGLEEAQKRYELWRTAFAMGWRPEHWDDETEKRYQEVGHDRYYGGLPQGWE